LKAFLKSIFYKKIHKASKMKISPHPKIELGLTLMSRILPIGKLVRAWPPATGNGSSKVTVYFAKPH
jgi:hypothetical protein